MSQPLILVVDEHDQPVGKATMEEADTQGLTRRIVRLMIQNEQRRILLQKRSDTEKVYPGRWDNSVAGHVDYGETDEQALEREAFEEIGIRNFKYQKIGSYYNEVLRDRFKVRKFNHVYTAGMEETPTLLSQDEVSSVEWFEISKIKEMIKADPNQFTDGVIEVIERYY